MESTGTLPGRLGGPLVGKAPVLHGGARSQRRPRVQTGSRGSRGRGEALLYSPPPPPLCRCEPWKSARWLLGSYPSTALCAVQAGRPFFSFLGALAKRGHDKRGDDGTSRCGRWIGRAVGMSNGFLRDLYVLYVQSFGTRAAWHGVPAALLGSSTERWEPPISFCMHGRVAPSFFFGPLSPATSLLAPLSSHNQVLRQGGSQRSHHQISPLVAFMRSPRSACGSVDPPPLQPPPAPLSPAVR